MRRARFQERTDGERRVLLWAAGAVALWLVALSPPALADTPVLIHDRVDAHVTDLDFCGAGVTVDVAVSGVQNIRLGDEVFEAAGRFRAVITNPATGAAVVVSSAGQVHDEMVSADHEGVHTHLVTFRGLPEKIQTAGGEVLLRDAGLIVSPTPSTVRT